MMSGSDIFLHFTLFRGLRRLPVVGSALILCLSSLPAQDTTESVSPGGVNFADTVVVGEVVITGNGHTKDFVITREMSLVKGETITREKLEYDRERIYSLRLFNRVQIRAYPSLPGKAKLVVEVDERWFIFPFPILGVRDRDWGKVYYGAGIVHNNFRGRNEKLFASFALGYDPSASLFYRNSFLDDAGNYFIDARATFSRAQNRSPLIESVFGEYEEKHFTFIANAGRRLNHYHSVWLTAGYRLVHVPNRSAMTTISGEGKDNFPLAGAGYLYDTRDLQEYPSMGTMAGVSFVKYGIPGDDLDFTRISTDLRQFLLLPGGFTLAGRLFTDFALGGEMPGYSRVFFGYGERIRGHFDTVLEGDHRVGVTTELHIPILHPRYLMLDVLPRAFGLWRFGVTAAIFANAGSAWFRDREISVGDMAKGYGAGIHLLLPYSAVLRIEYAWDERRVGEFIVDLGAAL